MWIFQNNTSPATFKFILTCHPAILNSTNLFWNISFKHGAVSYLQRMCAPISVLCVTKTQGITSCCLMKDRPHRASYQTHVGTKLYTDLNHTDSKHTHKAYPYTLLFFCKLNFYGDGNSWKQLHRAEAIGSSSINQLSSPTEHRHWKIQQMIVSAEL